MKINKNFLVIWGLSILAVMFVLPYTLDLEKSLLQNLPVPMYVVIMASIIQSSIMFLIASGLGVFFSNKVGLDTQVLGKKLDVNTVKKVIIAGVSAALLILIGDYFFKMFGVNIALEDNGQIALWKRILACFYGGIAEEVLVRLFVMGGIVWILHKFTNKTKDWMFWVAILIAAVVFGIGHLPATAALTSLTILVVLRAIVLNGIGGVLFGYLYWKKGLIYAIIAHFTADIMLILVLPVIISIVK